MEMANQVRRDIDHIIERVRAEIPGLQVKQLEVLHEGDDNGLWFITAGAKAGEVQIESQNGSCPFLIESTFSDDRYHGGTVEEVVSIVRRLYA
jgi:hypothetical protein